MRPNNINRTFIGCIVQQGEICGKLLRQISDMKVVRTTNIIRGSYRALSRRMFRNIVTEVEGPYGVYFSTIFADKAQKHFVTILRSSQADN